MRRTTTGPNAPAAVLTTSLLHPLLCISALRRLSQRTSSLNQQASLQLGSSFLSPYLTRALPGSTMSPLRGAVQEVQLQVLQQLVAQLVAHSAGGSHKGLAAALPLAELMALDVADPAACLQVLTRTKEVLTRAAAAAGDAGGPVNSESAAAVHCWLPGLMRCFAQRVGRHGAADASKIVWPGTVNRRCAGGW